MQRSAPILLLSALVALVIPVAAQARPLDDLRAAKLQAATATVTLSETRCPPGSASCGKTKLEETFVSRAGPRTRSAPGRAGFPTGLAISGKGTGRCDAESPTTVVTGPDGSVQLLGSAARTTPGGFAATRVAIAATKRGVRVAWLEPLTPSILCKYFDDGGTELALPSSAQLPDAVVSPTSGPRVLKRSRFSITVEGSQDWTKAGADGTQVTGHGSWKLRLDFVARGRSAAKRRSGAR